ncbi:bifunctional UDP-N-acetylglucosamine diphosphorylase/glucosamine-1-phosphate N-acetyltransferase GlmU [Mesoterricola silvestris]|uniref:Bifunctional protein GlmU n=1 Tax=Mesoterricola silvestris TaxID=2927979 RepID=A0AA48GMY1_9BACT|nr:bifunctional UDP-N-acetylglucosamine diphosphorylase/glucosamine-1-phosphate N-acetyltransferase GlmU [Mesoterricola silvestris]BDU72824.1 bifunctional protein GlmU [Mesoterricola silvestris]
MPTLALILAAGLGKRMKSSLPKVLHPILGDPSLLWVLRALPPEVGHAVVVVHHGKEQVEAALASWAKAGLLPCPATTVDQGEPLGTGHAVARAIPELDRLGAERVVILCGDVPLIRRETVAALARSEGSILAMDLDDPAGYGRVLEEDGALRSLVEHKDAPEAVRAIRRVNGGAYALPWAPLREALGRLTNANAQGEYYLTDAVMDVASKVRVAVDLCEPSEMMGMNSRVDQATLQRFAQERVNRAWMEAGVTFLDPAATLVGPRVELGQDVVLAPGARLEGEVTVGASTQVGQGVVITDSALAEGVEVRPYCVINRSKVGPGAMVGPFAHLREGTVLDAGVHMGNFVETKKSHLHAGAKANHLSYLGDCEVGERTNIGAGLITCNYDGFNKHRTHIGKDVFVGSDCQLVAPITLGDGCLIGAGSTLTQDVPADAIALTRAPLTVRDGGASRLRTRLKAIKQGTKR